MALENWLNRNVETEQYRSRVRCVALGLGDLKACSEETLARAEASTTGRSSPATDFSTPGEYSRRRAPRASAGGGRARREAAPAGGRARLPPVVEAASPPLRRRRKKKKRPRRRRPRRPSSRTPKFQEGDRVKARWLGKPDGEGTVVGVEQMTTVNRFMPSPSTTPTRATTTHRTPHQSPARAGAGRRR